MINGLSVILSFDVSCESQFDGGVRQSFQAFHKGTFEMTGNSYFIFFARMLLPDRRNTNRFHLVYLGENVI